MSKIQEIAREKGEYIYEGNYLIAHLNKNQFLLFNFDTMNEMFNFLQKNPEYEVSFEIFPRFNNASAWSCSNLSGSS